MSNVQCGKIITDVDPTSPRGRDPDPNNTDVLPAGIITVNVPAVYMARYVMDLRRARSITRGIGRGGPWKSRLFWALVKDLARLKTIK
jgi:hypothetical protein